jgi:hypothetical protein
VLGPLLLVVVGVLLLPTENFANLLLTSRQAPAEVARPELFLFSLLATIAAFLIVVSDKLYKEVTDQLGRVFSMALRLFQITTTLLLLWVSIVVFNSTPPTESKYKLARLYTDSNSILTCGLLMLATDNEYVVWGHDIASSRWGLSVWSKTAFRAAVFTSRWKLGEFNDRAYESECD